MTTLHFTAFTIGFLGGSCFSPEYLAYVGELFDHLRMERIVKQAANAMGAVVSAHYSESRPAGGIRLFLTITNDPASTWDSHPAYIRAHFNPTLDHDAGLALATAKLVVSDPGSLNPLKALTFIFKSFASDVVIISYREEGCYLSNGGKFPLHHKIASLQEYIPIKVLQKYQTMDMNAYGNNYFRTRMMVRDFDLRRHVFGKSLKDMNSTERRIIRELLRGKMTELFMGSR